MEVWRVPVRLSLRKQSSDFSHPVGSQFNTDASEEPRYQSARLPGVTAQKNKSERRLVLEFVGRGAISLLYLFVEGGLRRNKFCDFKAMHQSNKESW